MPTIYSMSDIHGCYESIVDSLNIVDLDSDKEKKLILIGDYVDGGKDSCRVIYHLKNLEETCPNQVKVLLGNHDKMFIDWYKTVEDDSQWLLHDVKLQTIKSFFSEEECERMEAESVMRHGSYFEISQLLVKKIMENHDVLLPWLFVKINSSLIMKLKTRYIFM